MIGFLPATSNRVAIWGILVHNKLGYIEEHASGTYFQNTDGQRVGRVIRWRSSARPNPDEALVSHHTVHIDWSSE